MNNLTKEQMLELAEIVTGQHAEIDEDRVLYTPHGPGTAFLLWSPAIDGAAWQAKQALEVIVAADKLDGCFRCKSSSEDDLLTAASLALISGGRS